MQDAVGRTSVRAPSIELYLQFPSATRLAGLGNTIASSFHSVRTSFPWQEVVLVISSDWRHFRCDIKIPLAISP